MFKLYDKYPLATIKDEGLSVCISFCLSYVNLKHKEGNNRPPSVNQISSVHNHDKAGNKCYTQDNTSTRENPSV